MKQNKEQIQINNTLLNAITPIGGMEFQRNKFYIGENIAKVYAVTKYPQSIEPGWLSKLSNIPRAVSCQMFETCDNGALIEHLSRNIAELPRVQKTRSHVKERKNQRTMRRI